MGNEEYKPSWQMMVDRGNDLGAKMYVLENDLGFPLGGDYPPNFVMDEAVRIVEEYTARQQGETL